MKWKESFTYKAGVCLMLWVSYKLAISWLYVGYSAIGMPVEQGVR
jgi:hypothetical protein